eukprot:gene236-356_t
MSQTEPLDQDPVFQLKGSMLAITVLELARNDLDALDRQLAAKVALAPNFFNNAPLVLALDKLPAGQGAVDLPGLMRVCRQHGLRTLAIRASRIEDIAAAIAIELPVLPPSGARERPLDPLVGEEKKKPEKPPEPTIKPTKIITSPVRGGQQIYAQGGDLVVIAPVSPGAELLADGNIHVYGPMRGRALAGIKGDTKARIFCQQLTAELVSIAGQYKVSEDLRRDPLWGAGVQVSLSGDVLNIILVVTSGKGGVGKTTTSAAIGTGLALRGHKTVIVDFDVGLRNLDLIMGCERRVVYDFVNVVNGEANLQQALIKDKRLENLYVLAASQTRDKDALTKEGVGKVLAELKETFEYVVCDSPAGIETGAHLAMYFADEAIVVTNPEVSSVRDSDRMLGLLASKSQRAEKGEDPIKEHLLLTRYNPERVSNGEMLGVEDVKEILAVTLLGVIPESQAVLKASNQGVPVILDDQSDAGQAYSDAVDRLLGKTVEHRFLDVKKKGFFERIFGGN